MRGPGVGVQELGMVSDLGRHAEVSKTSRHAVPGVGLKGATLRPMAARVWLLSGDAVAAGPMRWCRRGKGIGA